MDVLFTQIATRRQTFLIENAIQLGTTRTRLLLEAVNYLSIFVYLISLWEVNAVHSLFVFLLYFHCICCLCVFICSSFFRRQSFPKGGRSFKKRLHLHRLKALPLACGRCHVKNRINEFVSYNETLLDIKGVSDDIQNLKLTTYIWQTRVGCAIIYKSSTNRHKV